VCVRERERERQRDRERERRGHAREREIDKTERGAKTNTTEHPAVFFGLYLFD
jgi:hypothetical protein